MKRWRYSIFLIGLTISLIPQSGHTQTKPPLSESTEACLACHVTLHPGIVSEWKKSRHGNIGPSEALKKDKLERRISNEKVSISFRKM